MKLRRVVTGFDDQGKSVFVSDGQPPVSRDFNQPPGFFQSMVWATKPGAKIYGAPGSGPLTAGRNADPTVNEPMYHAEVGGGTRFLVVTFPPDSVFFTDKFNMDELVKEHMVHAKGIFERMEPDNPGMHKTDTVDYIVVLEGEVTLELDDGKTVDLKPHDIVIQNGTRHAWRNRGKTGVTILAFMVGATRTR